MDKKTEANGNPVVSLTLGILSIIIPMIGLILGVIGVIFSRKATKEIAKSYGNGRGFAVSGLICSIVGIVIQTLSVLSIIAYYSTTHAA
ncbi:DUF4190 domain-containing protein [Bacillus sp. BRMEA1]|uniref:DUF4190 domain-containing protein n=1 Tax=Neobacillus endophyticus TaxID=2738405 RepID=UPI0015667402|nr:DUF4190 domain-containing protein [Neobacillus endophyticus]NRD79864.1 DUF4190 domain-containing protein [Neobacillus endophyticus]